MFIVYIFSVFWRLPQLETLDGVRKKPEDELFDPDYNGKEQFEQNRKLHCTIL